MGAFCGRVRALFCRKVCVWAQTLLGTPRPATCSEPLCGARAARVLLTAAHLLRCCACRCGGRRVLSCRADGPDLAASVLHVERLL